MKVSSGMKRECSNLGGGGGVNPYNGTNAEPPPERGTFFRVGISPVEVYERVGNLSLRYVKGPKGLTDEFYGFIKSRTTFYFCD